MIGSNYYGIITINGVEIPYNTIDEIVIKNWVFDIFPKLYIKFVDDGYFFEKNTLFEGDVLFLELYKTEDEEDAIFKGNFIISDYTTKEVVNGFDVELNAYLYVDNIWFENTRVFKQKNSVSVLSELAKDMGLVFDNRHNLRTDDTMNWYQTCILKDFLTYVSNRISIPNDAGIIFCEAGDPRDDFKSKLVLTSLKKDLNKKIDFTAEKNSALTNYYNSDMINDDIIVYDKYNFVNILSYINKKIGYGLGMDYYDINENVHISDTISQPLKNEGRLYRFEENFSNNVTTYFGRYDNKNVYNGINETINRNRYYIETFFGTSLLLNINPMAKVRLMDLVSVDVETVFPENSEGNINEYLSGKMLVNGITLIVKDRKIFKTINLSKNSFIPPEVENE